MKVDLVFPISGRFPVFHEYPLFGAISSLIPEIHGDLIGENRMDVLISTISGDKIGEYMECNENSNFIVRTEPQFIPLFLKLINAKLSLSRLDIVVGNPEINKLNPSSILIAERVVISMGNSKNVENQINFKNSLSKQLPEICNIDLLSKQSVLIKGRLHLGYKIRLSNLSLDNSLQIMCDGAGGKKKLGCGMFFPC